MEERSQLTPKPFLTSPSPLDNKDINNVQASEFGSGTYVVRVPRDQVYRVPNSENGRIAELHRNSPPKAAKTSRCCLCCILFTFVFFILLILLGGVLGGLFSMLISPKDPEFSIQHFDLVSNKTHPEYDIAFKAHNSNPDVGISYKDRSQVTLSLDGREIAKGEYPALHQDPRQTTLLGVALKGSKTVLPKKVEESVKSNKKKVSVTFSLAIHSLARMKMGLLRSRKMTFNISCEVKLDTLANSTNILSQQCQTKRH
ncbi:unnamed protein product [Sphenostylis stenocarpa]|uniref:Late embryogenesis abundant protein LEA-2 subgroup domain-containing protein n=1 Tax=Sphenostylis stenocarpa TaxID=92480 RepID=A0AA86VTD7_9FABA|nr:unnamed protein product [Sphenostylis stenocarpa]